MQGNFYKIEQLSCLDVDATLNLIKTEADHVAGCNGQMCL